MTRERRSQARETPEPLGFIQINRDDGGRIRNISEGGLCFETFAPIERERLLQFWFSLNLRERIEAKGRLAWLDARQEIGGLQFLDLSPKARRHLRAYLGTQAVPPPIAHLDTNPAAQLAADFHAHVQKDRGEESAMKPKGSIFQATLAKYSLGELLSAPQASEAAACAEPGTQAEDARSERRPDRASTQGGGSSPWNPMSFVSLERHLNANRRQLLRGVMLGAVISLAVGAAAGWYLGRESARSEASRAALPAAVSPAVPGAPPISDVSAHPARPISSASVSARSLSAPRYAPENPPRGPVSSTAISAADLSAHAEGIVPSHDAGAKAAKKSTATPQQLWTSIQAGNMKAAVELADRFIQGDGVPVNCDQARILLLVASEKNNAEAIKKLHDLDKTGCPPQ